MGHRSSPISLHIFYFFPFFFFLPRKSLFGHGLAQGCLGQQPIRAKSLDNSHCFVDTGKWNVNGARGSSGITHISTNVKLRAYSRTHITSEWNDKIVK